jgi:hypothetical protein
MKKSNPVKAAMDDRNDKSKPGMGKNPPAKGDGMGAAMKARAGKVASKVAPMAGAKKKER